MQPAMPREVESEGTALLESKNGALPPQRGAAVKLFGCGSRDTVYSGSGSGDSTSNAALAQGLANAGFDVWWTPPTP